MALSAFAARTQNLPCPRARYEEDNEVKPDVGLGIGEPGDHTKKPAYGHCAAIDEEEANSGLIVENKTPTKIAKSNLHVDTDSWDGVGVHGDFESSQEGLAQIRLLKGKVHACRVCLCRRVLMVTKGLAITGQYNLWVREGAVCLSGAVFRASPKLHRVYAPACQPIPIIYNSHEFADDPDHPASLVITSFWSGLCSLDKCCTHFEDIWPKGDIDNTRSFHLAAKLPCVDVDYFDSSDAAAQMVQLARNRGSPLLHHPLEWQVAVKSILACRAQRPNAVLVCGPKGSGKSTFVRYISNAMLTQSCLPQRLALLDLDPGQPEFGCQGRLALSQVRSCVLGPPYTHPYFASESSGTTIRAYYLGSHTPRDDPKYYVKCAGKLIRLYEMLPEVSKCPLVVNTCGWVQGHGLNVLKTITKLFEFTDIVYMRGTGFGDIAQEVTSWAGLHAPPRVHVLPSVYLQPAGKTAKDLRAMQTASLFHLVQPELGHLRWSPDPLSFVKPIEMVYAGAGKSVEAIAILGESVRADLMLQTIEGSVLELVAFEGKSWLQEPEASERAQDEPDFAGWKSGSGPVPKFPTRVDGPGSMVSLSGTDARALLDPSHVRAIAPVLVHGVDIMRSTLRLICPVERTSIISCMQAKICLVLVRGKVELYPGKFLGRHRDAMAAKCGLVHESRPPVGGLDEGVAFRSPLPSIDQEFNTQSSAIWRSQEHATPGAAFRGRRAWKARRNLESRQVSASR